MNVRISREQLLNDSAVAGPRSASTLHPWKKPLPPILYKYYPPERFHVLTDCMVRFSQRAVFDDRLDLRPEVLNFGTPDEIRAFMEFDPVLVRHPDWLKEAVIRHVLNTPGREQELIRQSQAQLRSPEEFGVFCLCENSRSGQMWDQYASGGTGFVIAFNTEHRAFMALRNPGLIGKVDYRDEKIHSFLSAYGAGSFFRKKTQYAFEAEWRSLRALARFSHVRRPQEGHAIYLADFDPACVAGMLVLEWSLVEWELRMLTAIDCRYAHVAVHQIPAVELT